MLLLLPLKEKREKGGEEEAVSKSSPPHLLFLFVGIARSAKKVGGIALSGGVKAPRQSDERGRAGRQRERWAIGENGWWWAPSSLPLPP